jgi:hypothetical protein
MLPLLKTALKLAKKSSRAAPEVLHCDGCTRRRIIVRSFLFGEPHRRLKCGYLATLWLARKLVVVLAIGGQALSRAVCSVVDAVRGGPAGVILKVACCFCFSREDTPLPPTIGRDPGPACCLAGRGAATGKQVTKISTSVARRCAWPITGQGALPGQNRPRE